MDTTPESPAPSTEELAELEAEFARLEAELATLDNGDAMELTHPGESTASTDRGDG
jgi:hypothetical protein